MEALASRMARMMLPVVTSMRAVALPCTLADILRTSVVKSWS
jgi:hypothetical protein